MIKWETESLIARIYREHWEQVEAEERLLEVHSDQTQAVTEEITAYGKA